MQSQPRVMLVLHKVEYVKPTTSDASIIKWNMQSQPRVMLVLYKVEYAKPTTSDASII